MEKSFSYILQLMSMSLVFMTFGCEGTSQEVDANEELDQMVIEDVEETSKEVLSQEVNFDK
jgi:hypothetical protein